MRKKYFFYNFYSKRKSKGLNESIYYSFSLQSRFFRRKCALRKILNCGEMGRIMKLSKTLVSITSAAALTISAFAMAATVSASSSTKINDPTVKFDDSNIVASFGAMSDTHIYATDTSHDVYFTNALTKLQGIAGGSGKLDAVMIAGDLCDSAPKEVYPRMKTLWESAITSDHTELIPTIGNHDDYFEGAFNGINSFRDKFGSLVYRNPVSYDTTDDITNGNYHTVINGIHFISVSSIDGDNVIKSNLPWLDNQLSKAAKDNPYMPIFVETHVQPADTVEGSYISENTEDRWYTTSLHTVLDKYPQVVVFAGHTHNNGHVDAAVWRGAYTAVNTGSTMDPGARDCKLVQVDKNGVVRIRAYSTNDSDVNSQPLDQWVFATMEPISNPPTFDDLQSTTTPTADVLNVDFADGTANDTASSIAATTLGNGGTLADNSSFGKKVATFDSKGAFGYTFTDTQYNKMKNSTALDCTFNLTEAPSSGYVDILGNMNSAGQGFEYTSDHILQYYLRIGSSYVICEAQNIDPNKWINAVGTYDGSEVRFYINGLLVDRKKASGDITHPTGAARVYCVGADVSSAGSYESGAKVQINDARVYSKALNDTEAYLVYSNDINTKMDLPSADKFQAVQDTEYTLPTVTATDAVNGNVTVSTTVKSPSGKVLSVGDSFSPGIVGDYTVIYRANGLVKTQTLTVTAYQMIDKSEVTLNEGETVTLKATPVNPDDYILGWVSSDPTVATVDANGTVTAVKPGTAVITVNTAYKRSSSCTVTVASPTTTTTSTTTTSSTTGTDTTATSSTATTSVTDTTASVTNVTDTTTPVTGVTDITAPVTNATGTNSTETTAAAAESAPNTGSSQSALPYVLIGLSVLVTGTMLYSKKKIEQ